MTSSNDSKQDMHEVTNRLVLEYQSTGIVCALMAAITFSIYTTIPTDYEPKYVIYSEASVFVISSVLFVMSTYGCFLQSITVSQLSDLNDALSFHSNYGYHPWNTFQIATGFFAAGLIVDGYVRLKWFGFGLTTICCIVAYALWIYTNLTYRRFVKGKEKIYQSNANH